MAVQNSLTPKDKKQPRFSVAVQTEGYQKLINDTLRDPDRARRFVAAVTSAVSVNPALQECDAGSVLSSALLGESLNLSPSPQLGQYYMVPYKQKEKRDRFGEVIAPERTVAQFQLGYKGMIQLAVRSGYYRKIVVLPIKAGELVRYDPLEEEIVVNLIEDEAVREETPTTGYYAMFEYIGGTFRKAMYWSKQKMEAHADRFSPAFSLEAYHKLLGGEIPEKDQWRYSSFWYKNFDDMAIKTMLRQLLSRWGIMSIDLQTALNADEQAIKPDLTPDYLLPEETAPIDLASPPHGTEATDASATDADGAQQELPDGVFE